MGPEFIPKCLDWSFFPVFRRIFFATWNKRETAGVMAAQGETRCPMQSIDDHSYDLEAPQ